MHLVHPAPPRLKADRPPSFAASPSFILRTDIIYPITWANTLSRGRFVFFQRDTKSSMLTRGASHELAFAHEARAECILEGPLVPWVDVSREHLL